MPKKPDEVELREMPKRPFGVGFAQLQMKDALQFSDTVYGFGAGIFFVGYMLFEVPSGSGAIRGSAHDGSVSSTTTGCDATRSTC